MTMKHVFAVMAAVLLATPCWAAAGEDAGEFTFTVLQDGEPVGQHRFAFEREGDRIEIDEATDIEVKFAMIPVYTFEHHAHALWQNGRAVRIDATTDDNGKELDITVRDTAQGYVRTVNGRVDKFDHANVLAFWNKDTLSHDSFFSAIEDKTLEVSFKDLGAETITVAGQQMKAQHYRMVGDEERDLWFDPEGRIAKVTFERYGADIEYIRDQMSAAAPGSTCLKLC